MLRNSGGPAARYHSQLQSCSLCELVQQVSMSSGTSTPVAAHSSILMQDLNGCGSCGSVDIVTRVPCNQKVLYSIASCGASFPTRWLADARALLLVSPEGSRHRSETSRSLPRATTLEEAHDDSLTKHRPSRCRRSLAPRSFFIFEGPGSRNGPCLLVPRGLAVIDSPLGLKSLTSSWLVDHSGLLAPAQTNFEGSPARATRTASDAGHINNSSLSDTNQKPSY
jgi:hypothetical protein